MCVSETRPHAGLSGFADTETDLVSDFGVPRADLLHMVACASVDRTDLIGTSADWSCDGTNPTPRRPILAPYGASSRSPWRTRQAVVRAGRSPLPAKRWQSQWVRRMGTER